MTPQTENYIRRLDELFKSVNGIKDDEIKSIASEYLCVRVAGLVEYFFKQKVSEFTSKSCPKQIEKYITNAFAQFTNVNDEKIRNTLPKFDSQWLESYENQRTDNSKASLDSVIAIRHKIAHGGNMSMSYIQISQHYSNIKDLINLLDKIISKKTAMK